MAIYGRAVQRPIHPGSNDPAIEVVGVILHVDAGNNESLYHYFNGPSGGIESHFHIRRDGTVEQYRHTGFEADANYKANSFIRDGRRQGYISVETQGYGDGTWSAAQLAAIKNLLKWAHEVHGVPLQKATGPYAPGVGYHTLFPKHWTPYAKSCPGPLRIKQFEALIVPWMREQSKTYTRGGNIDDALKSLRKSRGKGERAAHIRAARKALRKIRKWVAR